MDAKTAFFLGVLGGLLAQFGRISTLRVTVKGLPQYVRHWLYWVQSIGWVLSGGVLAFVHTLEAGAKLTAWVCLNIGLTAPLIVQAVARGTPAGRPGTVA
jgi:hypothetical protein